MGSLEIYINDEMALRQRRKFQNRTLFKPLNMKRRVKNGIKLDFKPFKKIS